MKVPKAPPSVDQVISPLGRIGVTDKLMSFYAVGPTDREGRYLHWDDLRHRTPPAPLTPEEHWAATKLARMRQYRPLPFLTKAGQAMNFMLTDQMMRLLHWIDSHGTAWITSQQQLLSPSTARTYKVSSLIEEAFNSSKLEGAVTTRDAARRMIREGRTPRNEGEQMVLNNYHAMEYVRERTEAALTADMVFTLHRIVTEGTLKEPAEAGRFRTDANDIAVIDSEGEVLHVPPPASELEERVRRWCEWANAEEDAARFIHPVVKAIILHFMVGYDHPFTDGNGRTARALFYWLMARNRYWLIGYTSISRSINKAPKRYGRAYLLSETDECDLTYFILYHLEIIKDAIDDLHAYVHRKTQELEEIEEVIEKSNFSQVFNERQLKLLRHAAKHPGFTYGIEEHKNSHRIAYETARKDLLALAESGLLRKRKSGKAFVFVAPSDLMERIKGTGP